MSNVSSNVECEFECRMCVSNVECVFPISNVSSNVECEFECRM